MGPDSYKIYVVGDKSNKIIKDMIDEMDDLVNNKNNLTIDGKKIAAIDYNDNGDPKRAQEVAKEIVARNDVLLVVGHFLSSATKEALDVYLREKPPIPVIMVTETTPQILPAISAERSGSDLPVLRLVPTDDTQAKDIANYATSKKQDGTKQGGTFWVVEDQWKNTVYSHYLAEKIVQQVQEAGAVVLWSTNLSLPSVETLKQLRIQGIFFPGEWSDALILVQQVRAIWPDRKNAPEIFLTDASVNNNFLPRGRKAVEGVYLSHFLHACKYKATGHVELATDAFDIIKPLLANTDKATFAATNQFHGIKQAFKIHSVKDARRALAQEIATQRKQGKQFKTNSGKSYTFDERADGRFYIWQVKQGTFAPTDGEPCPK